MSRGRFVIAGALVVVLATCAYVPMAGIGFWGDDGIYQLVLGGEVEPSHMQPPWRLFDFGTAADWMTESDMWHPIWWSATDWQIRFLRPLSSFSMWLDYALWGNDALACHVMSLLWYAVALTVVLALYRGLGLGRGTALLALVLFAATNGALLPAGWISNRNTVLALTFTAGAVLAAVRLRPGWRVPVALGLAALACACKESGVVAFALVGVHMALEAGRTADRRRRRAAWSGAAAALGSGAAYVVGLAAAGYGTASLFYATPWHEPLRYLGRVGLLLTVGSLRLVAPVSVELVSLTPTAVPWLVGAALVVMVPLAVLVGRRVRDHRAAPLLGAWLVLALVAEGGAPPSDRLLLSAAVGSAGLLALFIVSALRRTPEGSCPSRLERAVGTGVLVTAGVLSGLFVPMQVSAFTGILGDLGTRVRNSDVGPETDGRIEAVLLQAGGETEAFVFGAQWPWQTGRRDVRFAWLQFGRRGLEWTREDERTCTFRSLDSPFLVGNLERVYLTRRDPQLRGSVRGNALFTVEPLQVEDGGLRTIRLRFSRSLDDPALRFLVSSEPGLAPVPPPAVGATTTIPTAARAIALLP